MKRYVVAVLFAGAVFLALGNLAFGAGQVAEPTNTPTPTSEATSSPAASTPASTASPAATAVPAASAPATVAPASIETGAPTPTPAAAASSAASNSSIPLVIVAGILEAVIIIGLLVFLYRGTLS